MCIHKYICKFIFILIICLLPVLAALLPTSVNIQNPSVWLSGKEIPDTVNYQQLKFQFQTLDTLGGRIAIADMDGDNLLDIVLHVWGSERGLIADGQLLWFRNPDWERRVIRDSAHFFGDGLELSDLDGDGDHDIITCKGNDYASEVWWYENNVNHPEFPWTEHFIDSVQAGSEIKDMAVTDIDRDGRSDIVVRTRFQIALFFQETGDSFQVRRMDVREREGKAIGDLDGDWDSDIVLNGFLLENPGDPREDEWNEVTIDSLWYTDETGGWQDHSVMTAISDFNADGLPDVVYGHSEKRGFLVSWYENQKSGKEWKKHEIEVVDYCHTLVAGDLDLDGDMDIAAANLKRSVNPKIYVFLNLGGGRSWQEVVIDRSSAYKGRLADLDSDGDLDLIGALSWEDGPIQIWWNGLDPEFASLKSWRRHQVDGAIPAKVIFVEMGDLNGDQLIDLAAGAWWWKNPGNFESHWSRQEIGSPLKNLALIHDFDQDGDLDVLGTQGAGANPDNRFAWARNEGTGNFTVFTNISSTGDGDFLQGKAIGDFGNNREQIALSWHNGGGGIHVLSLPELLTGDLWEMNTLSKTTLKEDLSAGDIDRDGDMDLLLGTVWLQNNGSRWTAFTLGEISDLDQDAFPDRNELADINGDHRLDAVIGLENGQHILWFEAPQNPTEKWKRHVIGVVEGEGFSLDVADFDGDLDVDVVIGEHRGIDTNRVVLFENQNNGFTWVSYIIDQDKKDQIDHHDGTRVVDLDRDGDLDIISIGWYNNKLWIYENLSVMVTDLPDPDKGFVSGFELKQNYPNPFNPVTVISWQLPASSLVNLSIYNLTGQKVAMLINGRQPAGFHEIEFDASQLASGIYFYRLETGRYVETRKMILLK